MTLQRIHKNTSPNFSTQNETSASAPRQFAPRALQKSGLRAQERFEQETFRASEFGATDLPGTERILRLGHNFADIPVYHPAGERRKVIARSGQPASANLGTRLDNNQSMVAERKQSEGILEPVVRKAENDTGLPDRLKAGVENLSGLSMDDVKVHRNSPEPARLRAHAFTLGTDIHLAAGREQHLSHEAWHVVQQKQGRVPPTEIRAEGASINDDPGLEREADRMGGEASKTAPREFTSSNNQFAVSQPAQGNVVQCKKVPTDFGEFETTRFVNAPCKGVDIILKFHPDENKVDARKIALSQSVKVTHESGKDYAPNPTLAARMVASGKPGAGYFTDASVKSNNPIYFETKNLGAAEDLKDTPLSGNKSANPAQVGVNTNYELGYCYKDKPTDPSKKKQSAGLWDMPCNRPGVGAGATFETAAFAIEGTDQDKYYGSVSWGYKVEGTAAAPTLTKTDIALASKGVPTANFIEPAKLWNVGKTQGTLKVSADPATVYQMDGSTTETLAKDTKLKQLDTIIGGPEAMIKAEVLKADGTGSGKLIFINVSDVKDMGDGSPNKKLPV